MIQQQSPNQRPQALPLQLTAPHYCELVKAYIRSSSAHARWALLVEPRSLGREGDNSLTAVRLYLLGRPHDGGCGGTLQGRAAPRRGAVRRGLRVAVIVVVLIVVATAAPGRVVGGAQRCRILLSPSTPLLCPLLDAGYFFLFCQASKMASALL